MIYSLSNQMATLGHNVTVCTIFECSDDDYCLTKLSKMVHRATIGKKNEGFSLKAVIDIFLYIQKGNFDVVNIHGFMYYYILSILLLCKKTRFFYTVHSDAKLENSPWDRKLFWIKKFLFRKKFVHPISISEKSDSGFYDLYRVKATKINNGIRLYIPHQHSPYISKYRYTSRTKVFVHPGRICKAKNQHILCQAFNHLIKSGFDMVLLIAGTIEDAQIFNQLKDYFSDRIVYVGERSDIIELMASADGMCLSSIWEGLPISLLEALSVGCIPVVTPVGGITNVIIDMFNGFIAKSTTLEAYISALENFYKLTEDQISTMKRNCALSAKEYDISRCAENYINCYGQ